MRPLLEWIRKETAKTDQIFVPESLNAYWVRIFGERGVFADHSFPFYEPAVPEFSRRFTLLRESEGYQQEEWVGLLKSESIQYVIMASDRSVFLDVPPVFQTEEWHVFKSSDLIALDRER